MTTIFQIARGTHPLSNWFDYGDVLYHGMTSHVGRDGDALQLARTGPFVPQVFRPGLADIAVTDPVKRQLHALIPGLVFRPMKMAHIVRLDWHAWDHSSEEPPEYPDSGEPEDYILEREHDPALSAAMGPIWELVAEIDPGIQGDGGTVNTGRYKGQHIARADIYAGYNFISPELKAAFESVAPGCLEFIPARASRD